MFLGAAAVAALVASSAGGVQGFAIRSGTAQASRALAAGRAAARGRPIPTMAASSSDSDSDEMSRGAFGRGAAASLAAGLLSLATVGERSAACAVPLGNRGLSSASSAGSRVNKDPSSLLRLGLPINCPTVRDVQDAVEAAKYDIYLKNWGRAISNCQRAKLLVTSKSKELLAAVRNDCKDKASQVLAEIVDLIGPLQDILGSKEGTGTLLEREKLDNAYKAQDLVANKVGELEELMVPADYVARLDANIPDEFKNLPRLLGRATVELIIDKPNKGEKFDIEGQLFDEARLIMVLDGYTAPVTCGCVLDLVKKGFYNGLKIVRSDGFVVQTGDPDPEGPLDSYIPPGASTPRIVPLEVTLKGGLPTYSETTEDAGKGAKATALPFQAYGALGMARSEFEADSASSQFFWLLFESDLTPAGKNLLDGRFAAFGYTTEGSELLKDVREGDVVRSAKVLSGGENLKK